METEERLQELENRIAYLERELELSYRENRFRQKINGIFKSRGTVEIRDGDFGLFARVTDIDGDDVQFASEKFDAIYEDFDYAITETDSGLGMEVWTEPEF